MAKLIGTDPNQVPTNADLGSAAYADTQNMPETRLTNQPLSAKFGAEGDVPTDLASTLDFMQVGGSTFVQTGSDAQAFIKSNHYWNGGSHSFVDTGRGSTTIRLNENNAGQIWFETAPSGGVATLARMIIDENGAIRKPYQPAFLVQRTGQQSNIAVGGHVDVAFDTEKFDTGGDFSSGTFTAPVTGKYLLSYALYLTGVDTGSSYYESSIVTSNRTIRNAYDPNFSGDLNYWIINYCQVHDMDAGDTAKVTLKQASGAQQTDIDGNSTFSGFLIG